MRLIELRAPVVDGRAVTFSWLVNHPATELYKRASFELRFPDSVAVGAVPPTIWWRLALLCLHAHWPLLRPCRVLLPVRLPPGEAEFWLRLTDAATATLEAQVGGGDTSRAIEIAGSGPLLAPPGPAPPQGDARLAVSCFSGGRDSTVQAALLAELGLEPLLVTVTSPGPWSVEHETPRRREVLREIVRRRSLELVECTSDLRSGWENSFVAKRYGVSVNELSDTFLYLAAAIAVAYARGAQKVMIASEAEVQANAKRGGMVIQTRHFMYSAVTLGAVSALFEPAGVSVGSLTSSLRQSQVQRLLSERYTDLRDLQYSCWELNPGQAACSSCHECRSIALNLLAGGVPPSTAGIDLLTLLEAHENWRPGSRFLDQPLAPDAPPQRIAARALEMQELRCLASVPPEQVAELLDGDHPQEARERALAIYGRLRGIALEHEIEPEPGYRADYLELVDERLRSPLRELLEQYFEPAPPESYAPTLANTRLLARWISRPLAGSADGRPAAPEVPPELIPDPEPVLEPGEDGRLLPVADTSLDGNELAYVSSCITDGWISSAGSFVRRFEQEFAQAVGCRYGVACSSGTAALHLALAAAGVEQGDEVIVPAFTMIATANAAVYIGAEPVLVDSDPATWNLDPERLGDKLGPRTRAVVAVHTYGQPADMDAICAFARRNELLVVEDAAEAHGASYGGRPVGSLGDVAAFSFYANKIITTGEGGMVTTNDPRVAELARELRDHAFAPERHFFHRRIGFNYRMTNLQAAVGVAQTERLAELVSRRLENARRYREVLAGIDGLGLPPEQDGGVSWMFGITVSPEFGVGRDALRRALAARGVETRSFFVPLHVVPAYRARFAGERYPVAEELGRSGLYLPSGPRLSADDIAYVGNAIRACRASA